MVFSRRQPQHDGEEGKAKRDLQANGERKSSRASHGTPPSLDDLHCILLNSHCQVFVPVKRTLPAITHNSVRPQLRSVRPGGGSSTAARTMWVIQFVGLALTRHARGQRRPTTGFRTRMQKLRYNRCRLRRAGKPMTGNMSANTHDFSKVWQTIRGATTIVALVLLASLPCSTPPTPWWVYALREGSFTPLVPLSQHLPFHSLDPRGASPPPRWPT
jgi:hypothetical protein